jgi:hypothetical protein
MCMLRCMGAGIVIHRRCVQALSLLSSSIRFPDSLADFLGRDIKSSPFKASTPLRVNGALRRALQIPKRDGPISWSIAMARIHAGVDALDLLDWLSGMGGTTCMFRAIRVGRCFC